MTSPPSPQPSASSGAAPWYKDAIIYELHVRAFSDSNGDGIGDINGLIDKLDYLQDLGVTALWLLPFYPSPLRDGGYDIADYTAINACYGGRRDFARLLREAHRRGVRIITELVLNHTSNEHPWFQRAREAPPASAWRDFYVWSDTQDRYADARIIFKDFETSNWAWDPVAKAYYWHRFYAHQPDLNFDSPDVQAAMLKVVDFWMEMGVDGLRLDAVPYLFERDGSSCENLPETHAFLRKLRAHVDARYPDRMLLAEANQWPADAAAYFGDGDECHMNFHFPLMPRMFMAVQLEDSFPILNILRQTPVIPESCQWATFLRNHDELTLEMVTDEDRDAMVRAYASERHARINLGIRRRLAPLLQVRRRIELLNALLFALPGTPVLYYGDEIGMGDNIYLGDRDGVRTPMQWSADRNAGFSRCNPQMLYLPVITDPEYHFQAINVEAQQSNASSLLWWMKRLIALRKQHRVFGRGGVELLRPENGKVLAFVRAYEGERVLMVANLSRFGQYVELDLARFEGMVPVELFGRARFPRIERRPYPLTLGPHDFFWFALEPPAASPAGVEVAALTARGDWQALLDPGRRRALAPVLLDYIAERRWFRGKARSRKGGAIADVVPIVGGGATHHVILLEVEYADGAPETYVLPLGFMDGDRAQRLERSRPSAIVATVTVDDATSPEASGASRGVLYDALATEELAATLLECIRARAAIPGEQGHLWPAPFKSMKTAPEADLTPRLSDAEQSNTTIIYGDKLLLKVLRLVEEGPSSEYEIGRVLTEQRGFRGAARLAGSIEYRRRGHEPTTIAILQDFIPNQGDAWRLTLDSLDRFFEVMLADDARGSAPDLPRSSLVDWPREEPPQLLTLRIGPYLARARLLGERTAALHLVLAQETKDPAFAPEPFTAQYQHSLYQSADTKLARTLDLLRKRRASGLGPHPDLLDAVLAREDELHARLKRVISRKIAVLRTRCHGDFHLGQVLVTGDDFVIIDFEGEPARPLNERRYKRCPLRDAAGMLRSFHYAAAFALRSGRLRPEDAATLAPWANAWIAWVSAAYLGAYLREVEEAAFVPASAADQSLLLDFYLLEKCIYEVTYELNSRPDWLDIPLMGILGVLGDALTPLPPSP